MIFLKEFLQDVIYSNDVIEETITDTSRWSIHYKCVFKHDNRFYVTHYRRGATESQDERPYEYDPAAIECPEVFPTQVVSIQYLTAEQVTSYKSKHQ